MAIIKRTSNLYILLEKDYKSISGQFTEVSKQVIIYATDKDLSLNSNKKIAVHGNKQ